MAGKNINAKAKCVEKSLMNVTCPSEAMEQRTLIEWAHYHPICNKYLIAIPNGGTRHPLEAVNLKRQGVKSGVSDLFLAYPVPSYHGLWIELKRRFKSKISHEQKEWISLMQNAGYATRIAYGWEEARDSILVYLSFSK